MNTYVTEEEQIEAIKAWWKKYGNHFMTGLIVVLLAIAGWKYWQQQQEKVKQAASVSYEHMMSAHASQDDSGVQAQANTLLSQYAKSVYADGARLLLAKTAVKKKRYQQADEYLSSVIQHSGVAALKQVARLRLARIYLHQKQYAHALQLLHVLDDDAYLPYAYELEGDVYAAQGDPQKARVQYQKAVDSSPQFAAKNPLLMMKLN